MQATLERNCSNAHQEVKEQPICRGTEQDDGKVFNLYESSLLLFSQKRSGSNAVETVEKEDQVKPFENLKRICLCLSEKKCNNLLSVEERNTERAEQLFIQHHKISVVKRFLISRLVDETNLK